MAKTELVTVELIKNPAVKRQMTAQSARMNSRKWRPSAIQPVVAEVVKKNASPVAVGNPKPVNPPVNEAEIDEPENPFVNVASDKETLQAEYLALAGKPANKLWKEATLKEKIAELNTNTDETA